MNYKLPYIGEIKLDELKDHYETKIEFEGKSFSVEATSVAKRGGRSLGDIIIFIVKAFAYFIIAIVGFSLIVSLFSVGIAAITVFPLKDFILTSGWQNAFAWVHCSFLL